MPRLFTGLEIPEDAADELAGLGLEMYGASWLSPDDYHVTLRFFGDVDGRVADEIVAGLDQVDVAPFAMRLAGLDCFGGSSPRALIARIEEVPGLVELHRAHERVARAAGLPPEGRRFTPHVTLARLKGTYPETVARFIQSFGRLRLPPIPVERFVLYSARPGTGGGPYVAEEIFPLRGTALGSRQSAFD